MDHSGLASLLFDMPKVCNQLQLIYVCMCMYMIASFVMLYLVGETNFLYLFVNLILVPVPPFPIHLFLHPLLLPLLIHHFGHP